MKKYPHIIISIILLFSVLLVHKTPVYAFGKPVWEKVYITDAFGDQTEEYYLMNSKHFSGSYNSASVNKGKIKADLAIQQNEGVIEAYIIIYVNKKDQLKNENTSNIHYNITIKKTDGDTFDTYGTLESNSDRIRVDASVDLAEALCAEDGEVGIYIEEDEKNLNNYLFEASCGNFGQLYEQEIYIPYMEYYYQQAESLLQEKRFDEAAAAFEALKDYSDSASRVDDVREAQKADAYSNAEILLANGQYDEAKEAFLALEDYGDSSERVAEIEELQKEKALALIESGDYEEAYALLGKIGDSETIINNKHERALALIETGDYKEAYALLEEIGDSETIINNKHERALTLIESGDYKEAYTLLEEIGDSETITKNKQERALALIESGDYAVAYNLLENIGDYETIAQNQYERALALIESGDYEGALVLQKEINNVVDGDKDISTKIESYKTEIKDKIYEAAVSLKENGNEKEAIAIFEKMGGYKESAQYIQDYNNSINENKYSEALELIKNEKYIEAYNALEALADYRDCKELQESIMTKYIAEYLRGSEIGDTVLFGTYEQDIDIGDHKYKAGDSISWRVIDKQADKVLVISEDLVGLRPFFNEYTEDGNWTNSELRLWLNKEFMQASFSEEEISLIIDSEIMSKAKPATGPSADVTSTDKVFLLSQEEAESYFSNDVDRSEGVSNGWILRDVIANHGTQWRSLQMECVSYTGELMSYPAYEGEEKGIRPAMWISTVG